MSGMEASERGLLTQHRLINNEKDTPEKSKTEASINEERADSKTRIQRAESKICILYKRKKSLERSSDATDIGG